MASMQHHLTTIFIFCALSVLLPHLVDASRRLQHNTCAMGTSSINLQEAFLNDDSGSVVYCSGTATVNQCEGVCTSMSTPSVVATTGYVKVCNCCREERLQPKEVILTQCSDSAGNALFGQQYPVYIPEPSSCSCQRCSL